MRTISMEEMKLVSGASGLGDTAAATAVGAGLGAAVGASLASQMGATGTAVLGMGGIGAYYGGGIGAAAVGGYAVGTWLNNNTPIQSWISDALPDPSGIDYGTDGTGYN